MGQVPHLQALNDKYREKGFEILAVSKEDANLIQSKLIEGKSATYGVVKADIGNLYSTRGIPHCWVLDAEGKCLFEGHPAGVTEQTVEGWIKDLAPTKVDKELAKELKGAVKSFDNGELGKALEDAKKTEAEATDETVKSDAQYLEGLVQKHVDLYNAKITKLRDSGNLVKLGEVLGEASTKFKGSELGDKWSDELKELEKSKEYKDTAKSQEELEKLKPKLEDMRASSARKALEKIAKKYPETPAGGRPGTTEPD